MKTNTHTFHQHFLAISKKMFFLFLFISGTLYAQPPIAQPNDLEACDGNGDGFEVFDLTTNETQTLNGINPSLVSVLYYETLFDAQSNINSIPNPLAYQNIVNSQTIYVRVEEISSGLYSTTSFNLMVNSSPNLILPSNLITYENPFDGFAIFDLTNNNAVLLNGIDPTLVSVLYYMSLNDAQFNINPIANPSSYENISNPQTMFVRVENSTTGCFSITNFDLIVNPDYIVFPDANFKAKLIALGVDTSNDGEIQYIEATNTMSVLDVSNSTISNLEGFQYFTNVTNLFCNDNQLTTLTLNNNTNLSFVNCSNNQISALNVNSNSNLVHLLASNNQLSAINLSNHPNLENLWLSNNQLTSLNVNSCVALKELSIGSNSLTNLNLSMNPLLDDLQCQQNQISTLDLTNNSNLVLLNCGSNGLTSLNVLNCPNLATLNCSFNNLITLNLSNNLNLTSLYFVANLQLQTVFIKNGSDESTNIDSGSWLENFLSSNNPNLIYVCADQNQIASIQSLVGPNVNVNSYCSISPGGAYNTISGAVQFDLDSNGCDVNDIVVPYLQFEINLNATPSNSSVFSNTLGNYSLYTAQTGIYELIPNLENPAYFNITPSPAAVTIPVIDNTTTTQNFCINANGVHPDLEIVIAPITPARPGFDAVYLIVYKNKGNQTVDGYVNFTFNDAVLDYVSSSVVPNNVGTGTINWVFPGLVPFETGSILVTLNVNSPTETPAVNIGDILAFNAFIDVTTDDNWNDNNFDFNQTVVGSYDPNDITCIEGDVVAPTYIGQYLHYIINFENTGTYQAENVIVKMEVNPSDFDINTLRLLNASHNVDARINGNIIEFIFQTINLDTGGHGNILLKVKTKADLISSDVVSKKANIYFDYNFPIETNFANTTFQVLSSSVITVDDSVGIYPNPAKSILNVKAQSIIKSIEIYDVQGRIVQTRLINEELSAIDVSGFANGIYFLKIKTEMGEKVEKIVKE